MPSAYEKGLDNFHRGELLAAVQEWEKVPPNHPHYQKTQEMIKVANGILAELVTLYLQNGSNLENEGKLSEALQEYQRALLLDSRRRDVEEKIQKVREIIAPLVNYHLNLARGLSASGRLQQALDEFRLVQVFDPNNHEASERSILLRERIESEAIRYYEAGLKHFQRRSYRAAKDDMKAVLFFRPEHEGAKRYLQEIEKALAGERRGENKGHPPPSFGLDERRKRTKELIAREDWEQARREAKVLLEIDPHDAEAKNLLAFAEVRYRGKVDTLLQQGIRYFQEENLDSAISVWRQVLVLDANHQRAKEYLEKASLMREKIRRIRGEKVEPGP